MKSTVSPMKLLVFVWAWFLPVACVDPAPVTNQTNCEKIPKGQACVRLKVFSEPHVKNDAESKSSHDLAGTLHWALYYEGEVGLFGPGDNTPEYEGVVENVDLKIDRQDVNDQPPPHFALSDAIFVQPVSFHVLAYLDDNLNDNPDDDEWVTYPTEAFITIEGQGIEVDTKLNHKGKGL